MDKSSKSNWLERSVCFIQKHFNNTKNIIYFQRIKDIENNILDETFQYLMQKKNNVEKMFDDKRHNEMIPTV